MPQVADTTVLIKNENKYIAFSGWTQIGEVKN